MLSWIPSQTKKSRDSPKVKSTGSVLNKNAEIQKAAAQLYDVFKNGASCTNNEHLDHQIRLCLETENVKQSVNINMLFSASYAYNSNSDLRRVK
jgi:hypothetical protein